MGISDQDSGVRLSEFRLSVMGSQVRLGLLESRLTVRVEFSFTVL